MSFFMTFTLISGFIIMSLFIGVISSGMWGLVDTPAFTVELSCNA